MGRREITDDKVMRFLDYQVGTIASLGPIDSRGKRSAYSHTIDLGDNTKVQAVYTPVRDIPVVRFSMAGVMTDESYRNVVNRMKIDGIVQVDWDEQELKTACKLFRDFLGKYSSIIHDVYEEISFSKELDLVGRPICIKNYAIGLEASTGQKSMI